MVYKCCDNVSWVYLNLSLISMVKVIDCFNEKIAYNFKLYSLRMIKYKNK